VDAPGECRGDFREGVEDVGCGCDGGDGYFVGGEVEAGGLGDHAVDGGYDGAEVVGWFAHSHEDQVVDGGEEWYVLLLLLLLLGFGGVVVGVWVGSLKDAAYFVRVVELYEYFVGGEV